MYEILKSITKKILPKKILQANEHWIRALLALRYRGNRYRCNTCHYGLKRFVILENGEQLCPRCGSLPRVRRLWHLLESDLQPEMTLLHFSPSPSLRKCLDKIERLTQITTDYAGEFHADKKLDITDTGEPSAHYDRIICYHILEHVPEDGKAMSELFRLLKTGGCCYIQTPFKAGEIYENLDITTPEERLKHFGQEDHVRIYSVEGLKKRLEQAGFYVEILYFETETPNMMGLKEGETVLLAKK